MIISALQAVDPPRDSKEHEEDLQAKLAIVKGICNKVKATDTEPMPMHQQVILFAILSRFITGLQTENDK